MGRGDLTDVKSSLKSHSPFKTIEKFESIPIVSEVLKADLIMPAYQGFRLSTALALSGKLRSAGTNENGPHVSPLRCCGCASRCWLLFQHCMCLT